MQTEAMLYEKLASNIVHCHLCAHQCTINPDKFGLCGVRQNKEGRLYSLVYGEAIAAHVDPIEKKPLYHFLPATKSYSIATIGCNFKCGFCQNWQISQLSKHQPRSDGIPEIPPQEIVEQALRHKTKSISYTYTEPTIFFEYAYDCAKIAKQKGLYNVFVTNGFMTPEALDTIRPFLDAANVDLKSFRDDFYKDNCGARLGPVLDSIHHMKKIGIWVEITTLLIPQENDSLQELNQIAGFIASVDKNIPWHISRFHPDYKFTEYPATSIEVMYQAREIAQQHGLCYVYLGNIAEGSDTLCPQCNEILVKRSFMQASSIKIQDGTCPRCQTIQPGVWQ